MFAGRVHIRSWRIFGVFPGRSTQNRPLTPTDSNGGSDRYAKFLGDQKPPTPPGSVQGGFGRGPGRPGSGASGRSTASNGFRKPACLSIGKAATAEPRSGTHASAPSSTTSSPSSVGYLSVESQRAPAGRSSSALFSPQHESYHPSGISGVEFISMGGKAFTRTAVELGLADSAGRTDNQSACTSACVTGSSHAASSSSTLVSVPFASGSLSSVQGKGLLVTADHLPNSQKREEQIRCERANLNRKNLHRCPLLRNEANLRLLNFQNNFITKIENLSNLVNLVFLDMYNNNIEHISGLECLFSLRVLMLGRNKISEIENLESLTKLDVLDLHQNQISVIENVSHLRDLRVLNLESNNIVEATNFVGLDSLTEFNLSCNQVTRVSDVSRLTNLRRILLSDNAVSDFEDVQDIFRLPNIVEFSLENNPVSANANYRPLVIARIRSLKTLDGRRVMEEERRNASKVAKKEAEKLKESERLRDKLEERERMIEFIQRTWGSLESDQDDPCSPILADSPSESMFSFSSSRSFSSLASSSQPPGNLSRPGSATSSRSRRGPLTFDQVQKMTENQNSYAEMKDGHLYIYGQAFSMIDKLDPLPIIAIHIRYISMNKLGHMLAKLRRFPNLTSLHLENNKFAQLKQVNYLVPLQNVTNLDVQPDQNPVVTVSCFRQYVLYRLSHLPIKTLCGVPVSASEIQAAGAVFAGLLQTTLRIPCLFQDSTDGTAGGDGVNEYGCFAGRDLENVPDAAWAQPGKDRTAVKSCVQSIISASVTTAAKRSILQNMWPKAVEEACYQALLKHAVLGPEENQSRSLDAAGAIDHHSKDGML